MTEFIDTADHRPDVYREGDRWVFRASTLGNCDGQIVRTALGYDGAPAPKFLMDAYREGQKAEPLIIERLAEEYRWLPVDLEEMLEYGTIDESGQLCLEMTVGSKALIRLHPDGVFWRMTRLGTDSEERRVGEVKCLGRGFAEDILNGGLEAKPSYAWQYSVECAITQLPGIYVIGMKHPDKRDDDGHRVLDPDQALRVNLYDPPYTLAQIKGRVLKLVGMIERGDVPDCTFAQYPCSMYEYHDTETGVWEKKEAKGEGDGVPGLTKEAAADLAAAGRKLENAQKRGKREKELADDAKAEIDKAVANHGVVVPEEGIEVHGVRIKKESKKGSVSWKSVAKEHGADVDKGDFETHRGASSSWWTAELVEKEEE